MKYRATISAGPLKRRKSGNSLKSATGTPTENSGSREDTNHFQRAACRWGHRPRSRPALLESRIPWGVACLQPASACVNTLGILHAVVRSEEHTSELQSPCNLV